MKVVVDTNVLVSGLFSPFGPPAQIVRMIASADLSLSFDARLLSEYREVLHRPKFGFSIDSGEALLDQIAASGESTGGTPLDQPLPDRNDEPFLEVALSGKAEALITGNLRHYPKESRKGVRVVSPVEFLEYYKGRGEGSR